MRTRITGALVVLVLAVSGCGHPGYGHSGYGRAHYYSYCVDHYHRVVPAYYCHGAHFGYHPFYATRHLARGVRVRSSWGTSSRPRTFGPSSTYRHSAPLGHSYHRSGGFTSSRRAGRFTSSRRH